MKKFYFMSRDMIFLDPCPVVIPHAVNIDVLRIGFYDFNLFNVAVMRCKPASTWQWSYYLDLTLSKDENGRTVAKVVSTKLHDELVGMTFYLDELVRCTEQGWITREDLQEKKLLNGIRLRGEIDYIEYSCA